MAPEARSSAEAGSRAEREESWASHRGLSVLVSATAFLLPVLVAIAAAALLVHLVSKPRSGPEVWIWWVLVVVSPWAVYVAANRMARRALPLAALLKMTLVFPDHAPGRLAVARKAGSTRSLERHLQQSQEIATQDELSVAAEHILALATSLSKHDRMTRGHSERVRALTDLIAEQLNLPTADRNRLRWAALLHDIGKLSIPASVLNKSSKPDADEWETLLRHPLEGKRLVAPLAGWLGVWAATVPEHHERYDGRGYPLGLVGEQISLGGRIVAVADSYDAMTAARSYSKAITPALARQELTACAGSQFDPVVVRAFLEASVGRLSVVGGPLAWLGELSTLNGVPQLGQAVSAAGNALAGLATVIGVGAAVAAGAHHVPAHHRALEASPAQPARHFAPATVPEPRPYFAAPVGHVQARHTPPRADPPVGAAVSGKTDDPRSTDPQPVKDPSSPPPRPSYAVTPTSVTPTTRTPTTRTPTTRTPTTRTPTTRTPTTVAPTTVATTVVPTTVAPTTVTQTTVTATTITPTTVAPTTVATTVTPTAVTPTTVAPTTVTQTTVTATTVPGAPIIVTVAPTTVTRTTVATTVTPTTVTPTTVTPTTVTPTTVTPTTVTPTTVTPTTVTPTTVTPTTVTPTTVPGAPSIVTVTPGNGTVTVNWTAPSSDGGSAVTAYTVVAADLTTPANGAEVCTWTTGPLNCTLTGLTNGDSYIFMVMATNAVGTGSASSFSNPVTPATVPGAPSGGSATPGNAAATVTWTAPSDGGSAVTAYTVVAADLTTLANGAEVCTWTTGPLTCTLTGLTNGDSYSFTVTATNGVGTGTASSPSNPVTPATVPGAPSGASATPGNASATVTWTAPSSDGGSAVTAYTVVAADSTTPANGGEVCTWTTGPLTCTLTGLTNGDSYSFTVTATNVAGGGAASSPSNVVTPTTVPGAPSGASATPGNASATVTWTAPSSDGGSAVTAYTVVAADSTTPANGGEACTWTTGPLTCTITGVTNGDSYSFTVQATNVVGSGAASSPSNAVTPATVPGAPSIVSVTPGNGTVTVTWTAPSSDGGSAVTAYTVVAGDVTTPANGGEACNWTTGPLTCTVTGLTNGDTYIFGVSATNVVGTGATSAVSGFVTPI